MRKIRICVRANLSSQMNVEQLKRGEALLIHIVIFESETEKRVYFVEGKIYDDISYNLRFEKYYIS